MKCLVWQPYAYNSMHNTEMIEQNALNAMHGCMQLVQYGKFMQ